MITELSKSNIVFLTMALAVMAISVPSAECQERAFYFIQHWVGGTVANAAPAAAPDPRPGRAEDKILEMRYPPGGPTNAVTRILPADGAALVDLNDFNVNWHADGAPTNLRFQIATRDGYGAFARTVDILDRGVQRISPFLQMVAVDELLTAFIESVRIDRVADTTRAAIRIQWDPTGFTGVNVYRNAGAYTAGLGGAGAPWQIVGAAGSVALDDAQVRAGEDEIYYRAVPADAADRFAETPILGKRNITLGRGFNVIETSLTPADAVNGDPLSAYIGNQLGSGDVVFHKPNAGQPNYLQASFDATRAVPWNFPNPEFRLRHGSGYFVRQLAAAPNTITLVGRVSGNLETTFAQGFNLFGLGIPRSFTFNDPMTGLAANGLTAGANDTIFFKPSAAQPNYLQASFNAATSTWNFPNPTFGLDPGIGYFYRRTPAASTTWRRSL